MYAYGKKMKALSLGLAAVMALAPVAARATDATSFQNMPVTGTAADGSTFAGTFTVNHFQASGKQLLAVGTLTGTFTNPTTGAVTQVPATSVAWPVQQIDGKDLGTVGGATGTQTGSLSPSLDVKPASFHPPASLGGSPQSHPGIVLAQSCSILDLVLGPLHLDLLGLVVDLNQVHLQITAQQGSGNLLGNLLCAVANLLNGTGGSPIGNLLQGIANLLNQILAALGGL